MENSGPALHWALGGMEEGVSKRTIERKLPWGQGRDDSNVATA